MTLDKLIDLVEGNTEEDNPYSFLLNAINDWPGDIQTYQEYLIEVKSFLEIEQIDIALIRKKIKEGEFSTNIWKIESITGLLKFLETPSAGANKIDG